MKRSLSYDPQSYIVLLFIFARPGSSSGNITYFLGIFFLEEIIKWLEQIQSIIYLIIK